MPGKVLSYHRLARRELRLGFAGRWCAGSKIETAGGVFQAREAEAGAADRGRAASDAMTSGNVRLITERPRHEPEGSGRKRRRVG